MMRGGRRTRTAWRPPYRCGSRHLQRVLQDGLAQSKRPPIDAEAWAPPPYQTDTDDHRSGSGALCKALVEANLRPRCWSQESAADVGRCRGDHRTRVPDHEKAIGFRHGRTWCREDPRGLNVCDTQTDVGRSTRCVPLGKRSTGTVLKRRSLATNLHGRQHERKGADPPRVSLSSRTSIISEMRLSAPRPHPYDPRSVISMKRSAVDESEDDRLQRVGRRLRTSTGPRA